MQRAYGKQFPTESRPGPKTRHSQLPVRQKHESGLGTIKGNEMRVAECRTQAGSLLGSAQTRWRGFGICECARKTTCSSFLKLEQLQQDPT